MNHHGTVGFNKPTGRIANFFVQTSAPDDTKIVSGEDMEAVDDWVHQMPRFFTQESCFILFRAVYYGVRCTCVGVCVSVCVGGVVKEWEMFTSLKMRKSSLWVSQTSS